MLFLKIVFIAVFAVITGRLVQVQVIESERYKALARTQYEDKLELRAIRGAILDREGRPLVSTATVASIAADPRMLGAETDPLARHLAGILHEPLPLIRKKLSTRGTNFVWIVRQVDPAVAAKVDTKRFPGVIIMEEPKRVYHYDDLAGQLLGFTDLDCRGISGLELQFDASLRGMDGYEIRLRDGLGRAKPALEYPRVEAVNGEDLRLTIDLDYQAIAEEALRRGVEESEAESGLVVMMDPATGEILAMANHPRLHPAKAGTVERGVTRNRAVTDMFEPGSVFKIVTASAALEHGLVRPTDKFFAENGSYKVPLPRGRFRTITDTHEHGTITFQEAVEVSSNIVMAKISDKVGAELLYRSARDFGFGTKTGVELPGEIRGELKKPTDWSGTTLNTISYGYEVGVTPLQIAAAYCAIANGGTLYRPTIVLRERAKDTSPKTPQVIRKVVSRETAAIVSSFFVGVVERGTGTGAHVNGVAIAGKTGTARKVLDGQYNQKSYTATFAGFFPANDPKVVCVVMLDTRSFKYSGGQTSAPIFKAIASQVLGLSDRFAGTVIASAEIPGALAVPSVTNVELSSALYLLAESGFQVESSGKGNFVVGQSPRPGTKLQEGGTVRVEVAPERNPAAADMVEVPDLRSVSVRRAMNSAAHSGLTLSVRGSGIVVSQSPGAGEHVRRGAVVQVQCRAASDVASLR